MHVYYFSVCGSSECVYYLYKYERFRIRCVNAHKRKYVCILMYTYNRTHIQGYWGHLLPENVSIPAQSCIFNLVGVLEQHEI